MSIFSDKEVVESENYIYHKTSKGRLFVTCPKQHYSSILKERWIKNKTRCSICKEIDYFNSLQEIVSKEQYVLNKITKAPVVLFLTCPEGHNYKVLLDNWKKGNRCGKCQRTFWTYEDVQGLFKKEGYELLTTSYKQVSQLLKFICPQGHRHKIRLLSWLRGSRCGICFQKKEVLDVDFTQYNLKAIAPLAKHTDIMDLECLKCSYHWTIRFYDWNKRKLKSCPKCRGYSKYTLQDIQDILHREGYQLLSTHYGGAHKHLEALCPNKHSYQFTLTNFLQGYRCRHCTSSTSAAELELLALYASFNPKKSRTVIPPKELDLYFDQHKLAIEYCGLYWHSSVQERITSTYHYNKWKDCNDLGIRLITIFEDQWIDKKDLCLAKINQALGMVIEKEVTDCVVRTVSMNATKEFLNENYLFETQVTFGLGLYLNNQLVQLLATFEEGDQLGIVFCTLKGHSFDQGAQKLFEALLKKDMNKYSLLKGKVNLGWETGEDFKLLGFRPQKYISQSFSYLQNSKRTTIPTDIVLYDCGDQIWIYDLSSNH